MNVICLAIDRLHAGYLGPYGNTWIETPAIDRLAAESMVFDQVMIDTPTLDRLYRSYWQGWHAMCLPPPNDRPSLPELLRDAGVGTALMTDERLLAEHPLAVQFDDLVVIDPPWQPEVAPEGEYEQTHLARCFAEIVDWLEGAEQPFLLWCHLASLGVTWDAPPEFRLRYWDEDDPLPPAGPDVPDRILAEGFDPDEALGFSQAYAGQVTLLDTWLGGLMEFLRESPLGRETLVVLTSPRGFPLGEHRRIGPADDALYAELLQAPLILRFPDGMAAAARSQALVEPADLWATLLDCCGVSGVPPSPSGVSLMPVIREDAPLPRDRLCCVGPNGQRAIRTPAWYLRVTDRSELYAKPDDCWEANDVASRCLEVVECLEDALAEFERSVQSGSAKDLPPLGDVLLTGLE